MPRIYIYMMTDFAARTERRQYQSRTSAVRYATGRGLTIVDSWPLSDGPPTGGNAQQWDAWRLRRGVSGSHS